MKPASMSVELVAFTQFAPGVECLSGQPGGLPMELPMQTDPDDLHELAGRECYQSFHKPNPETAETSAYLKNIIDQGHTSVLEHANFTFRVTGVSRALLLELERHRHLSFSVLSQRYVSPAKFDLSYVEPPRFSQTPSGARLREMQREQWAEARRLYDEAFHILRAEGADVKQAREAARALLPGSAETRFIVTGNTKAWRHIIEMRTSPGADAEICRFATRIQELLVSVAPGSMQ